MKITATLIWLQEDRVADTGREAEARDSTLTVHTSFLIKSLSQREEHVRDIAVNLLSQLRDKFPQVNLCLSYKCLSVCIFFKILCSLWTISLEYPQYLRLELCFCRSYVIHPVSTRYCFHFIMTLHLLSSMILLGLQQFVPYIKKLFGSGSLNHFQFLLALARAFSRLTWALSFVKYLVFIMFLSKGAKLPFLLCNKNLSI